MSRLLAVLAVILCTLLACSSWSSWERLPASADEPAIREGSSRFAVIDAPATRTGHQLGAVGSSDRSIVVWSDGDRAEISVKEGHVSALITPKGSDVAIDVRADFSGFDEEFVPRQWIEGSSFAVLLVGTYGSSGAVVSVSLERSPRWALVPTLHLVKDELRHSTSLVGLYDDRYAALSGDDEVLVFGVDHDSFMIEPIPVLGATSLIPGESASRPNGVDLWVMGDAVQGSGMRPSAQAFLAFDTSGDLSLTKEVQRQDGAWKEMERRR